MIYEFKAASLKDVFELSKLVNLAYRGEAAKVGWTTEAELLEGQRVDTDGLSEMIEEPQATILCARSKQNPEILACVHLKKELTRCYLGMLTVKPQLQNSGIGKLMMEQAEQQARIWSCDSIYMTVISLRTELIAYYERRGFKSTGESQPFPYGNPRFGLPKRNDLQFAVLEKRIAASGSV